MIIIGYQAIGKSSLVGSHPRVIDLESGNFWIDGKRSDDWFKVYCKIAVHLSEQGFIVCTSSHEVVRQEFRKYQIPMYIIHPSLSIKDDWLTKLESRYKSTQKDKDYKAWQNALAGYDSQIQSLIDDPIPNREIKTIHYDLLEIITRLIYPVYPDLGVGLSIHINDVTRFAKQTINEYSDILKCLAAKFEI